MGFRNNLFLILAGVVGMCLQSSGEMVAHSTGKKVSYRVFRPGLNQDTLIENVDNWHWFGVYNQNSRFHLKDIEAGFRRKDQERINVFPPDTGGLEFILASAKKTFPESRVKGRRWHQQEGFVFPGEHKPALKGYEG